MYGRVLWALMVATVLVALAGSLALAQPPEPGIEPLPRRISVLLTREPMMSVAFNGRYGPMRLTGTLARAPEAPLRLEDFTGQTREARWDEIRELALVRTITADLPAGSFTAMLSGDAGALSRSGLPGAASYAAPIGGLSRPGQPTWRLRTLPEGELVLRGEPFQEARVPIARVTELVMQPILGNVAVVPDEVLGLEFEDGATVNLKLTAVQSFRRDRAAGVATVTLNDGQIFSGKVGRMPAGAYEILQEGTGGRVRVPVDRIAQLEIVLPPAGSLATGG